MSRRPAPTETKKGRSETESLKPPDIHTTHFGLYTTAQRGLHKKSSKIDLLRWLYKEEAISGSIKILACWSLSPPTASSLHPLFFNEFIIIICQKINPDLKKKKKKIGIQTKISLINKQAHEEIFIVQLLFFLFCFAWLGLCYRRCRKFIAHCNDLVCLKTSLSETISGKSKKYDLYSQSCLWGNVCFCAGAVKTSFCAPLITSCISFHISSMFCGPDLIKNVRSIYW